MFMICVTLELNWFTLTADASWIPARPVLACVPRNIYFPLEVIHGSMFAPRRHLPNGGIGIHAKTDDMFRLHWNQLDVALYAQKASDRTTPAATITLPLAITAFGSTCLTRLTQRLL